MLKALDRVRLIDYGGGFEQLSQIPAVKEPYWIILEGEDGVGKTTLAHALKNLLTLRGSNVVVEAFGRHFVPDEGLTKDVAWMRFAGEFATRMPVLQELVEQKVSIIQDRSFLSTTVYQGDQYQIFLFMDALFHQWGDAPTHIFILPPYGGYNHFRYFNTLWLPISGRKIHIIAIPPDCSSLEERVEFIMAVLERGMVFQDDLGGETDEKRTVDTDTSDTKDGTGGDADGESDEADSGLGHPLFSPTATQLSNDAFATLTHRTQFSDETMDATTTNNLGGVAND